MPRPKNTAICLAEGCDKLAYSKGYCRPHWWRQKTYGRLHKITGLIKGNCTVDGCDAKIKGLGFCRNHLYIYKKYNIHPNEYYTKLKNQNFTCEICEEAETSTSHNSNGKIKRLAVDHCHKTLKVRGLLCNRCNTVLGRIEENLDLLDKMKNYLIKHNGV